MTSGAPTDPVRRRPGGRSARVVAAVLQAARDELAEVGYGAFSLEAVAQRAGVHKTTVYRRWNNREQLMLDAMLEAAAETVPIPDRGSLRSDLLTYLRAITRSLARPEMSAIVRSVAAAPHTPALTTAGRAYWSSRFEAAEKIYSRAVARGEIPRSTDPHLVTEMLLGPIYLRLLVTGERTDRNLEAIVDFVLAGARAANG